MKLNLVRQAGAAVAAVALFGALAACGGSGSNESSGSGSKAGGTFTFWDPYPQFDDSSDWVKLVKSCGQKAGVTVKRTGYDTTDLTSKVLLAAQQGAAPDIIDIDNPVISTLADAGALTSTDELNLDTSQFESNILAAGQLDNKTYGVPIGANTLALYYNADILKKAGVDPASIKDWNSLNAALAKVKAIGKKGISFSAIGTEEGSFQFLPWFWGAGGDLTKLDSPQGVAAVQLWKDWLDKGYAPNSVLNNTQTTAWQDFETGNVAFDENGTWQLANAEKEKFPYGIISIPAKNGGGAPVPTGGEFLAVPAQNDTSRYATDVKIINCLTSPANLVKTDNTLSYVAAIDSAAQQQVRQNPKLKPWADALANAKGRTSDNLGTKYPIISEQMWGAFQKVLSGSVSPEDAMKSAQETAASKTQ